MQSESTGEQPIPVGILENIAPVKPGRGKGTHDDIFPCLHVRVRIADDNRFARRAAGRMQAHDFAHRHRKQPVGIGIPQIDFLREGETTNVVERA